MVTDRRVEGSLQIPLLLILFTIVIAGCGIWGFLRHWRFMVETQLRLNQCVGRAAHDFRDTLNSLFLLNQKILELRASIEAAKLYPPLIPPLEAGLIVVVSKQDWIQVQWKAKSLKWFLSQGCGQRGDHALPLPGLEFTRDPPDSIGPKALRWSGQMPKSFHLQIRHFPRVAAAKVQGDESDSIFERKKWISTWTVPQKF